VSKNHSFGHKVILLNTQHVRSKPSYLHNSETEYNETCILILLCTVFLQVLFTFLV